MNILRLRLTSNKKLKGRKRFSLSNSAKNALHKGHVSKHFWTRFDARHKALTMRVARRTSVRRAVACTRKLDI